MVPATVFPRMNGYGIARYASRLILASYGWTAIASFYNRVIGPFVIEGTARS
jgi:hypothetical protein